MFGDDFGNTFLDRLQEISLPEPVAWTPQTVGWYVLAALLALGLLLMVRGLLRRWAADGYRRAALAELGAIGSGIDGEAGAAGTLSRIAGLLKRTALAAFPREEVAGLSGEAWLGFLDATANTTGFSSGPGRILADQPYRRDAGVPAIELRELVTLARRWIQSHRRPDGGRS